MAKAKPTIKVTTRGFRDFDRSIRTFLSNIPDNMFDETNKVMHEAMELMKDRTSAWSPSTSQSGMGIAIHDSFIIISKRGQEFNSVNLKNIAPHASAVEGGVVEHTVYRYMSTKLAEWMDINGIPKGLNKINVGGPHSNIKKGNSDREFFNPVLDEMATSGRYDEVITKALDDAIDSFRKNRG